MKAFKDCLTVKELLDSINYYIKDDPSKLNDSVMIADDGTPVRYFNVKMGVGSNFSREIKPAVIEKRKEKIKKVIPTFGNYHWEDKNGKVCFPGEGHIVSNGETYEIVEQEVPYQIAPPEYKKEDVFLVVTDLYDEAK